MDFKKIVFLSVFIISIIAVSFVAFAEETPAAAQEKNDTQWAWGEVTNLDSQAKTLTIKYLDYETDQEKELVLAVDDKTTFENIKGLDELKLKDTLSVDYTAGPDNKNIAKNISLEKPDALPPVPAQTKEAVKPIEAPVAQPAVQSETPVAAAQAAVSQAPVPAAEPAPAVAAAPAAESASEAKPVSEPAPTVSGEAQ